MSYLPEIFGRSDIGAAVILKGSKQHSLRTYEWSNHTYVSPVTAALWVSLPLPPRAPVSMYFFALSQAPPAVLRKRAIRIPETVANINMDATTLAPRRGCPV